MSNLVKLTLFGDLGTFLEAKEWELNVKSVAEAIRALNSLTRGKFSDYFIKKDKLQAKYRVLINGRDFDSPEREINENNWYSVKDSELIMIKGNLKTIDIVPVLESSDPKAGGLFASILGAILIVVGILVIIGTWGGGTLLGIGLIVAGLTLTAAGAIALLSRPPDYGAFNSLQNSSSQSYLFSGPINTIGEGNPIPVGYGTMLIGSNVISAGYNITEFQTFRNS